METLDLRQKADGTLFVKGAMLQVMVYLAAAFRWANHQAGIQDEVFWRNLFLPTQKDPILKRQDGNDPDCCPEQPYGVLDLQACVKYLLYGGERRLPGPEIRYAQDSVNVLRTFGLETRTMKQGGVRPKPPYLGVLYAAISLRNQKEHANTQVLTGVTLASLEADLKKLESVTDPLTRKDGWLGDLQPLPAFWKDTWTQFRERFGCPPVSLEELGQEIFLSDELSPEQRQALEAAAQSLNLDCRDGSICGEDRQRLKKLLSAGPEVSGLLGVRAGGGAAGAGPEAPPSSSPEAAASLKPVPETAAALLRRGGGALPQQRAVLSALLDQFTLLVDESLFLAAEGRELLNERLAPLLMKRKERLRVDESVVNSLFRIFRRSGPCSPMELSQLALSGMSRAQVEDMQDQRREEHRNCKTAIKTLRFLRQRNCLEVIFSPTDSTHSYDNIRFLTNRFPAVRFLVLTMDRQLAGELRGRANTAAAKPDLDGETLRVYQATKPAWQGLLTGMAAAPAPAQESAYQDMISTEHSQNKPQYARVQGGATSLVGGLGGKATQQGPGQSPGAAKHLLTVTELPRAGSAILAVWPDGTRRELRLGALLGKEGGEGAVYTVNGPDPLAAKIYHRGQLTQERREKLLHMVRVNPDIPGLCWPKALAFNRGGEWTGFLMPRVTAKELCQTIYKPGRDNRTIKALNWDRKTLVRIAANTAGTFAKMHRRNILMGDVNPRNFMVGGDGSVYFVDCDSYQFERFPCPVRSDRYTPPEILREVRRSGQENYNYIRTLDHERYSMAVVLFEILMLGKSPYESRNTDSGNVLEAIMDGNFPYPFHVEGEENARRIDQAPAGRWREIWSHMPYQVKSCFYNAFTGKVRQSAMAWEQTLQEYLRLIEEGHSSRALLPEGFKNVDGTMLTKVCSQCGASYTIDEETYLRRTQRKEPELCPTHYTNYHNYRSRRRLNFCAVCGGAFETTVALWLERAQQGKPMLCRDCVNTTVRCSSCGKDYSLSRDRLGELNAKKVSLLCPECLELQHPTVTCEGEGCQRTFRTSRQKVEQMRRMGRPLLCPECLERMRGGQSG